jgi:photosystem II stability/assembly factor-like uncharacterized protein
MKKLILILFFLNFISAYGQWIQVFPSPYTFVDVDFFDENIGFLVSLEEVLKSCDGGNSWQTVIIPGSEDYYSDIVVINKDIIWNASGGYLKSPGNGVLCKSEDGGNTWETKLADIALDFYDLYFFNENLGWLSTYSSYYYYTTDAGETWTLSDEMPADIVKTFYFIDENTGWVCGGGESGYIAKTTDGGISWETQLDDPLFEYYIILDIEFVNDQKGFAASVDRTFLATTDGGNTWEYIATTQNEGVLVGLPENYRINEIEFIDENLGWITGGPCCGNPGQFIMSTTDGGTTWQMDILDDYLPESELRGLDFNVSGHGWATGVSGLTLKTFFPVNIETTYTNSGLHIFPNPINSHLFINSPENINSITLFNELGKTLYNISSVNNKELTIDLSEYQSGIYFIKVDGQVKKVIKK